MSGDGGGGDKMAALFQAMREGNNGNPIQFEIFLMNLHGGKTSFADMAHYAGGMGREVGHLSPPPDFGSMFANNISGGDSKGGGWSHDV